MDETTALADACRRWRDVISGTARLDPPDRIEALTAHLVHLYAAALRLPAHDEPEGPPPDPAPWPDDWPELGALDTGRPPTTLLLRGVTSDVTRGLAWFDADDAESAARWWRSSFDARWGLLAVVALERLHRALVHGRAGSSAAPPLPSAAADHEDAAARHPPPRDSDPPGAPVADAVGELAAPREGGLLSFEPAPPERRPTGRLRARSDAARGVLGLRFDVRRDGLHVAEVHPAGPAAGLLGPGDVIVSVDGVPLGGRSLPEAGAALAGPPGQARTFLVQRGAGLGPVTLAAVAPEDLAGAPVTTRLLVLDRDAAAEMLDSISELGLEVRVDPDQEGLVELDIPADATDAARQVLAHGHGHGWWEILD